LALTFHEILSVKRDSGATSATTNEEQSTKRDSSSTHMPATNNQMSSRGIQTDVTFIQKPQAAIKKQNPLMTII